MEVHHPHHLANKKNWKEYLSEFVMLFAAVTLGFFAENLREHKVIERKMSENYYALIEDLKQDSIKIQTIFDSTEKYEPNIVKFKYMLFLFHKKEINWDILKFRFEQMGPIPNYTTLFLNNASFKNMQSSGMLSYIEGKTLKSKLSYYYEVDFKKLEDNNKIFDATGIEFFQKQLPYLNSNREILIGKEELVNGYPESFSNKQNYKSYIYNLNASKIKLISENLIFAINVYSGRYYFYNGILHGIYDRNQEVLKLLRNIEN